MTWAARRRLLIFLVLIVIVGAVLAFIFSSHKNPSCSDGIQNQGEQGIDCGGPCATLCSALLSPPVVRFTQVLSPAANRADILAYVDNKNHDAAANNVPYTVTLYAADRSVLKSASGKIDLPPSSTVPIFIPNFFSGKVASSTAFLAIAPGSPIWYTPRALPSVPTVESPALAGTTAAPRVTATLMNQSTIAISDLKVVAVLFDASDNVIAASQTLVSVPAEGSALATFTWPAPFAEAPARIEITPILSLTP